MTLKKHNRLNLFKNDDNNHVQPDPDVALSLMNMLNKNNQLIKAFRYAREHIEQESGQEAMLPLLGCNTRDGVQYNLPSCGEITSVIIGDYSNSEYTYYVLLHDRKSGLKRVSCLHPCYMALQYPLSFVQ
jgi:hypothetical protein